ncbi:MAG: lactonase family protein [Egibacteraceae bacterium]
MSASSSHAKSRAGAVYALTNQATGNAVTAFNRAADGTLTMAGTFLTGGFGNGRAGLVDPLGSQDSLILSADNRFLFAVNALSDEISVLAVEQDRLTLVDVVASGGRQPISLALHSNLLYVLNSGAGTITGFTLDTDGKLTPLSGSTQTLSGGISGASAQVGFTPDGNLLVVTEKVAATIATFAVDEGGLAGPPMPNPSNGESPFGFVIARNDLLIVSEAMLSTPAGATSSYRINGSGKLDVISESVSTNQIGACWAVVNDKANPSYAYVSNSGSAAICGYAIGDDGTLSLLDADGRTATTGAFPVDIAVAAGQFLYTLVEGPGTVEGFRIESDGSLAPVGVVGGLPGGSEGLTAY